MFACVVTSQQAGQVEKLYELVGVDPKQGASYTEAWDLRRLITFGWKRQLDSFKRGQTPRESCQHAWHV